MFLIPWMIDLSIVSGQMGFWFEREVLPMDEH